MGRNFVKKMYNVEKVLKKGVKFLYRVAFCYKKKMCCKIFGQKGKKF